MLRSLLRYPSPGLPNDLRTGHAEIDALLTKLDAALIGSAKVRRHTVIEVRDDLLESLQRARDAGGDERAAVDDAVSALGSIDTIASEQRAARAALFRKVSFGTGLAFATLMLGVQLMMSELLNTRWPVLAGIFVFHALFFGLWMGYFAAYVIGKAEPSGKDNAEAGAFLIHYPSSSKTMSWGLAIFFTLLACGIGIGLAGIGPFGTWPPLPILLLVLLDIKLVITAIATAMFSAHADADRLTLRGPFGQQRLPRDGVRAVQAMGIAFRLLWIGSGMVYRVTWQDVSGRSRISYLSINQELVHGDRLLAWLETAVAANSAHACAKA
jgi:hypothetical protein